MNRAKRLKKQLKALKVIVAEKRAKLHAIQADCVHVWGKEDYAPKHPENIPRWKKMCKKCGKKRFTNKMPES